MAVQNNLHQVSNITFQGTQNTSASSSTSSAPKNINMTDNTAEQELLKRLGITKEQLETIKAKYSDFLSLSPEKQIEIVSKINAPQPIESTEKTTTVEQTNATTQTPEKSVVGDDGLDAVKFDNKAFEAASNEEKAKIYAEELAKNKFMYTDAENKKTAQDWNALSDAQKQSLIKTELDSLSKHKIANILSQDDISKLLQYHMTELQAANLQGLSLQELRSRGSDEVSSQIHDYIFAQSETGLSTKGQEKYLEEQKNKSEILIAYAKKHGLELPEGNILPPAEINKHCKELGVTIQELEKQALETRVKNGEKLSDNEKTRLEELTNLSELISRVRENIKDGRQVNFGRLEEFDKTEYGALFNSADSIEEKIAIAIKYLQNNKQGGIKFASEFITEIYQKDPELAAKLHSEFVGNTSGQTQLELAQSKTGVAQELNAYNINSFDKDGVKAVANYQKDLQKTAPEQAESLGVLRMHRSNEQSLLASSKIDANFGNTKVEQARTDASHDHTRVSVAGEKLLNEDTFKYGSKESRKYAGTQNYKSYKENQIPLHSLAIKDKDVNDAMVKAGTYAKYAPENQLAGLNMHKDRFIQGDYSQQEIDNGLSALASQIKNCDVSVQSKAIESIVATGNVKATEVAVANLCTAPQVVQDGAKLKDILNNAYPENPIADTAKSEIQQKIASGAKLTPQEYFSLSDREKTEYKANFFKSLPAAKQIAMLSSLTDVTLKKTIFKRLVSQDKNFFRSLVESDANTATFAYDMHIGEEIVMEVAKRKAASDIKFALLSQKIDADYEKKNSPLASTENNFSRNYTTDPNGFKFDPKELFKLDKNGNILA